MPAVLLDICRGLRKVCPAILLDRLHIRRAVQELIIFSEHAGNLRLVLIVHDQGFKHPDRPRRGVRLAELAHRHVSILRKADRRDACVLVHIICMGVSVDDLDRLLSLFRFPRCRISRGNQRVQTVRGIRALHIPRKPESFIKPEDRTRNRAAEIPGSRIAVCQRLQIVPSLEAVLRRMVLDLRGGHQTVIDAFGFLAVDDLVRKHQPAGGENREKHDREREGRKTFLLLFRENEPGDDRTGRAHRSPDGKLPHLEDLAGFIFAPRHKEQESDKAERDEPPDYKALRDGPLRFRRFTLRPPFRIRDVGFRHPELRVYAVSPKLRQMSAERFFGARAFPPRIVRPGKCLCRGLLVGGCGKVFLGGRRKLRRPVRFLPRGRFRARRERHGLGRGRNRRRPGR